MIHVKMGGDQIIIDDTTVFEVPFTRIKSAMNDRETTGNWEIRRFASKVSISHDVK